MQSDSDPDAALSRTRRARRDDITAAAIEVLDREGFAAATLDRIAAAAGTGKGVVLYHFGSKEAVFEAVVGDLFSRGAVIMTERILAETSWRARLHAYLDSNLRFIADNAAHVTAVHRILENAPTAVDQDGVAALRDLLAKGQDAGELGDFDPQVIALMIRAVVDAASFYFTENPDVDIDHHIAQAVRAFDRATTL